MPLKSRTFAMAAPVALVLFVVAVLLFLAQGQAGHAQSSAVSAGRAAPGGPGSDGYVETGDLEQIGSHGKLRVLVPLSAGPSMLPRGTIDPDYGEDIAAGFARKQGLSPVFVYQPRRDRLLPMLLAGKADIVAANLTITAERKSQVAFTDPLALVTEQVVAPSDDAIAKAEDLAGRSLTVRRSSSYWETATTLAESVKGLKIIAADEHLDTEQLIGMVASREIDLTLADDMIVESVRAYLPSIKAAFDVSGQKPIAWAVRPDNPKLLDALNRYLNHAFLLQKGGDSSVADWDQIVKRGSLRVLTRNNAVTYFIYRGRLMGFEYELANHFAQQHKLRTRMVIPPSHDDLLSWLLMGKGDVVAASMTVTEQRKQRHVAFSRPYNTVSEVLVCRKSDQPKLNSIADLAGRRIVVRRSSSYWHTLENLKAQNKLDFILSPAPPSMETEQIIDKVASGEYDLTVADSHILDMELTWRNDVAAAFPLGEPIHHAWAVRASNKQLLEKIDAYFEQEYKGLFFNMTYNKYFKTPRSIRQRAHSRADVVGQISPYDKVVYALCQKYGFNWRLVTAQMFQESHFDPHAKSWVGAVGLMQVMPRTGKQFGFTNLRDPATGIHAGIRYLDWLRTQFGDSLTVDEKMWFLLAAYNAGLGHVQDAQDLATAMGWNRALWFDNVERAMLLLADPKYARKARYGYVRGSEPVKYVQQIRQRFRAYNQLVDLKVEKGPGE